MTGTAAEAHLGTTALTDALRSHPLTGPMARRIERAAVTAVLVGAPWAFACDSLALPSVGASTWGLALTSTVLVLYLTGSISAGRWRARRVAAERLRWLLEGRAPSAADRARLLRFPFVNGAEVFSGWLGASVLFGLLVGIALGGGVLAGLIVGVTTVLSGLTSAALVTLMVQAAMRPVVALALENAPPRGRPQIGLRARLLVAWVLGSGIPLAGIGAITLAAHDVDQVRMAILICLIAGAGLVAGSLMTVFSSRTVTEPVDAVADALARIERGDREVRMAVDDPGELGVLQTGVNRLVEALEERERVRVLFGRHVGEAVAADAMRRVASLGGETCEASVVAVDVIGSTTLAEDLPAAEVVAILNALFAEVVRAVSAHGGWVNKFEGDGALCIVGVPKVLPDHAARALAAALDLRAGVRSLRAVHPELDVGIGVSSGTVVAGNVGAEERYEFTVIGPAVNEAARLCELAKRVEGRLLASGGSIGLAAEQGRTGWTPSGEVALRGRRSPTALFVPAGDPVAGVEVEAVSRLR